MERRPTAESPREPVQPSGPMPPHAQFHDFLPKAELSAFTEWAITQEDRFKPAKIFVEGGKAGKVDADVRQALKLRDLGGFEAVLSDRLNALLPAIEGAAGYRGPRLHSIDFEVNAYGDGAHFQAHRDIAIGSGRAAMGMKPNEDRFITAVFYFYREPKRFDGGALRLYRFGATPSGVGSEDESSVAFEPVQNSLVVFPSWATHAVERVTCPSGRFADFRFALNCWFCRS